MEGVHDALVEQTAALSDFAAYATRALLLSPSQPPFTCLWLCTLHSLASKTFSKHQGGNWAPKSNY
jgi:hypothetical protein